MAMDILSILPMSDEAKRDISGVRRTMSWDRARLGAHTVAITELLGNWNKNGLIHKLYIKEGEGISEMPDNIQPLNDRDDKGDRLYSASECSE
jgi:hypothetical protein